MQQKKFPSWFTPCYLFTNFNVVFKEILKKIVICTATSIRKLKFLFAGEPTLNWLLTQKLYAFSPRDSPFRDQISISVLIIIKFPIHYNYYLLKISIPPIEDSRLKKKYSKRKHTHNTLFHVIAVEINVQEDDVVYLLW